LSSYALSAVLLSKLLIEGKNCIGEILLGNDFSLRHREDIHVDASKLKLHEHPDAAREIARYDGEGNYRPLKTAPSLCRGWLLRLQNMEEMVLALDFFYPAALNLYGAWLEKNLKTTLLRETLNRQSGMYRVTQQISDEQAAALIKKQCHEGCLRKTLWMAMSDQNVEPFNMNKNEIPLLCREACNLFVAQARKVVKEEKK